MAKGQKRNNREQKKPKQNKVKIATVASPFAASPASKLSFLDRPARKR